MADGLDANDLLGHGVLGRLIAKIWLKHVDDDRRQSVLWAILDAANETHDEGLYSVVAEYTSMVAEGGRHV
jgi:hypothetical protein